MAWPTGGPDEQVTGTLITAAIYNGDLIASLVYLKAAADTRQMIVKVQPDDTTLAAGTATFTLTVPEILNGWNLSAIAGACTTPGTAGTASWMLRNGTINMLSTPITIDANEYSSYTAAAAPVIDTSNDGVATGNILKFVTTTVTTGMKGQELHMQFQKP
jgi:hypothetical protein